MADNEKEMEYNLATEIHKEQKSQNKRLFFALIASIISNFVTVVIIVIGFLLYMYQYDFTSTIEQTGLYTFIDSEGNVISSDITPQEMKEILEIIDGKDKGN